jgi:hypothetical protein
MRALLAAAVVVAASATRNVYLCVPEGIVWGIGVLCVYLMCEAACQGEVGLVACMDSSVAVWGVGMFFCFVLVGTTKWPPSPRLATSSTTTLLTRPRARTRV